VAITTSKRYPEFYEVEAESRIRRRTADRHALKAALKKIVSVPRSEIHKREAEYQKRAALNPRRRGPKRKVEPSASPGPGADA
jgi:hypothetical protein